MNLLGVDSGKVIRRDFDFRLVRERVQQDDDALIGLELAQDLSPHAAERPFDKLHVLAWRESGRFKMNEPLLHSGLEVLDNRVTNDVGGSFAVSDEPPHASGVADHVEVLVEWKSRKDIAGKERLHCFHKPRADAFPAHEFRIQDFDVREFRKSS